MFDIPEVMRMAQGMARHAASRQVVIAENIAQADTPGYQARDLPDFGAVYAQDTGLKATRPGHITAASSTNGWRAQVDQDAPSVSPNGNTVSLEREMMRSVHNRQAHDMALSIYGSTRSILRTSLGR